MNTTVPIINTVNTQSANNIPNAPICKNRRMRRYDHADILCVFCPSCFIDMNRYDGGYFVIKINNVSVAVYYLPACCD